MSFPNSHKVIIPGEKLTNYLLSRDHPIGRWKAKFFKSIGFDETNLNLLTDALRSIAENGTVTDEINSGFGTKFIVEGQVATPHGGVATLTTVWILERGEDQPRFVTAYPS